MPEVDVERLTELLTRARAICELVRGATQNETAERLRSETLGAALRMAEDLLSHALSQLPAWRTRQPSGHTGFPEPEGNGT